MQSPMEFVLQPVTTSPLPLSWRRNPFCATSAGSSFLLFRSCVHQIGAFEKFRFRRTRHQAANGDALSFNSFRIAKRKRIKKSLAGIIDGLKLPGMKPAMDPVISIRPIPRVRSRADFLYQINSSRNVGINNAQYLVEILIEKSVSQSSTGIGEQASTGCPFIAWYNLSTPSTVERSASIALRKRPEH